MQSIREAGGSVLRNANAGGVTGSTEAVAPDRFTAGVQTPAPTPTPAAMAALAARTAPVPTPQDNQQRIATLDRQVRAMYDQLIAMDGRRNQLYQMISTYQSSQQMFQSQAQMAQMQIQNVDLQINQAQFQAMRASDRAAYGRHPWGAAGREMDAQNNIANLTMFRQTYMTQYTNAITQANSCALAMQQANNELLGLNMQMPPLRARYDRSCAELIQLRG